MGDFQNHLEYQLLQFTTTRGSTAFLQMGPKLGCLLVADHVYGKSRIRSYEDMLIEQDQARLAEAFQLLLQRLVGEKFRLEPEETNRLARLLSEFTFRASRACSKELLKFLCYPTVFYEIFRKRVLLDFIERVHAVLLRELWHHPDLRLDWDSASRRLRSKMIEGLFHLINQIGEMVSQSTRTRGRPFVLVRKHQAPFMHRRLIQLKRELKTFNKRA